MDIGYVWDEKKYEIVRRKHQVTFSEVVAALEDPNAIEMRNDSNKEDRWISVGQTNEGRVLVVIFTEEDLPLYRIITAYNAEGAYLNEYKRQN